MTRFISGGLGRNEGGGLCRESAFGGRKKVLGGFAGGTDCGRAGVGQERPVEVALQLNWPRSRPA